MTSVLLRGGGDTGRKHSSLVKMEAEMGAGAVGPTGVGREASAPGAREGALHISDCCLQCAENPSCLLGRCYGHHR